MAVCRKYSVWSKTVPEGIAMDHVYDFNYFIKILII